MNEICYGCHNCGQWERIGTTDYGNCRYIRAEATGFASMIGKMAYVQANTAQTVRTHMDFFCNQHDLNIHGE